MKNTTTMPMTKYQNSRWLRSIACVLILLAFAWPAAAQGTIIPFVSQAFYDSNGNPLSSGKLCTYAAGTTTPLSTYSDVTLTTPNANPIILTSSGRPSTGAIFLSPTAYKFILLSAGSDATCSTGTTQWTLDNVTAIPPTTVNLDVTGTAGETIAAGQVVYLSDGSGSKNAGQWYLADADFTYASSNALSIGMAPAAISSGASGSFRVSGRMTALSGLVAGTRGYVSATAGALTTTAPTNVRLVGSADSTTSLVLASQPGYASDLLFSGNNTIRRDTTDASDTGSLVVTGGGAADQTRGALLVLTGNENGSPGSAFIKIGNVAASNFQVLRADGTSAINLLGADGSATLTSSAAGVTAVNSSAANGGYITIQRSGVDKGYVGSQLALGVGSGTNNDIALSSLAGLYVKGATSTQVSFPATQNPSSDVNTLDDYEEGSWTPVVAFGGGSTGITYTTQVGWYVKIGQLVIVGGKFNLSAKGSSTGGMSISGLPFTSIGTASFVGGVTFVRPLNFNAGVTELTGAIQPGTTRIDLYSGATVVNDTHVQAAATQVEGFIGAYRAAN
jgi:hypothetical protein